MDGKKTFVSYSWQQKEWVRERLCPCLEAGGATVLIDRQFVPGKGVLGQMDDLQDQADVHLLVLSPEYLQSDNCRHEMDRALALDKNLDKGIVIPILREDCSLPDTIRQALYLDLRQQDAAEPWDKLLQACQADLGVSAPEWLQARDAIRLYLERNQSVNLVVKGQADWRGLLRHLVDDYFPDLLTIDLNSGATAARRGLVEEILWGLGESADVPEEPEDLGLLHRVLNARNITRLALTHFDLAASRENYGVDFFAALETLIMDPPRKLVLLAQSRSPFPALLARFALPTPINIRSVELGGRP